MDNNFPRVITVFNESEDAAHSLLYSSSIRSSLRKLLPREFMFAEFHGEDQKKLDAVLENVLPVMKWNEWGKEPFHFSVLLLCRNQMNAGKFFYEMMSRWLLPGKRLQVESFLSTNFTLPDLSDTVYLLAEMVLCVEEEYEIDVIRRNLPILENEIRLGVASIYQANRILEIKGLFSNEKTALIQETISSLIQRRPQDFDYDIFSQMQHFLVMCREEFKEVRQYQHMSRIIYVFYLFRKTLKALIESNPDKRHISFKLSQVRLHLPFGIKKVLGVFVGISFLKDNEVFEEKHLIKSIKICFPEVRMVEDSLFAVTSREDKIQIVYLEVEKEDGKEFTHQEISKLRSRLPEDIKNHVEKLMPSVFMPRNEEEVMKNIIMLSHELKYLKDIPQLIISFDEQTDTELTFTVVLLRLLINGSPSSIQELYKQSQAKFKFVEDRVKRVGTLRNKYPKEATVFRLKLPKASFMREDHSVDLLKARQEVSQELHSVIGEFRDYNGGMIAKQHETLLALKKMMGDLPRSDELLLEDFFHSLYPVESRSLVNPLSLKILFQMFLEMLQIKASSDSFFEFCVKEEEEALYLILASAEKYSKQKVAEIMKQLALPSSQFVSVSLINQDIYYLGCLVLSQDKEKRDFLVKSIEILQEELRGVLAST